jgi:hypothetical protein
VPAEEQDVDGLYLLQQQGHESAGPRMAQLAHTKSINKEWMQQSI